MTAMRKHLAPALLEAYQYWNETDDLSQLQMLSEQSQLHWNKVADGVANLYAKSFEDSTKAERIEAYINSNKQGV